MSYILDALKKSEQQRSHGNIPDVQTIHSSSLNYKTEKKPLWPLALLIAVLLNFAAIVYFIIDKDTNTAVPVASPATSSTEPTASITTAPPVKIKESSAHTANTNTAAPVPVAVTTTPTKVSKEAKNETTDNIKVVQTIEKNKLTSNNLNVTATASADEVMDFYDLDDSFKRVLPTITISAHVYSTNPLQRSIVINNNFMEEGEYLIDDVILHEITRDGAIFNYNGTLFHYGVVSTWQ